MREYGRKGLTIVGVSNEPATRLEPFISKHGIEYAIAVGGASEYRYRGIPHAWLVSPSGKIVWDGHPANLSSKLLEAELKNVQLVPVFKLPKALKKAQDLLNKGDLGKGIKSLKGYLEEPASKRVAKRAKKALKKARSFGSRTLEAALQDAEDGHYGEAIESLTKLKRMFKGHEVGDKASVTLKKWKRDKSVKAELAGLRVLNTAKQAIREKKYKKANALLESVLRSKKLKGTKVRERAEKEHRRIQRFL